MFQPLCKGAKGISSGTDSNVAKNMFKAVREFSKTQPKYVQDVRFVIFQNELLDEFLKIAEDSGDSKSWFGNVWKGVKSNNSLCI